MIWRVKSSGKSKHEAVNYLRTGEGRCSVQRLRLTQFFKGLMEGFKMLVIYLQPGDGGTWTTVALVSEAGPAVSWETFH